MSTAEKDNGNHSAAPRCNGMSAAEALARRLWAKAPISEWMA